MWEPNDCAHRPHREHTVGTYIRSFSSIELVLDSWAVPQHCSVGLIMIRGSSWAAECGSRCRVFIPSDQHNGMGRYLVVEHSGEPMKEELQSALAGLVFLLHRCPEPVPLTCSVEEIISESLFAFRILSSPCCLVSPSWKVAGNWKGILIILAKKALFSCRKPLRPTAVTLVWLELMWNLATHMLDLLDYFLKIWTLEFHRSADYWGSHYFSLSASSSSSSISLPLSLHPSSSPFLLVPRTSSPASHPHLLSERRLPAHTHCFSTGPLHIGVFLVRNREVRSLNSLFISSQTSLSYRLLNPWSFRLT